MSYVLIGSNATVNTWGSANFYSALLALITPASARVSISNNGQDITAIGASAMSEIAGLVSATCTIGGFAGIGGGAVVPGLGNSCSVSFSGGTVAPYAINLQTLDISLRTVAVHDITTGSSGSPATFMSFRPDIIQASARFTALVDSSTGLKLPDISSSAALNQAVFTYLPSSTITFAKANVRTLDVQAVRGNKQLVTYGMNSVGSVTSAGGVFGTNTFGDDNVDPLWSQGGSAVGAMDLYLISGGAKKVAFADSFWTGIDIRAAPNSPVGIEIRVQPTGTITLS